MASPTPSTGSGPSTAFERPQWRTVRPGFWVGLLAFTLAITPFRVVEVSGRSMSPTRSDGDRYLMDRFYYRTSGLKRDDVVVLSKDGDELVKRLVGMPGDRLEIVMGPEAIIFELVNRTTGQQSRWRERAGGSLFRRRVTVPPDHVYVLGDNWWASDDSRSFGPVPISTLHGVLRTFTLNRNFTRKKGNGP
jgi:signal peptidase I